MIDIKFPFLKYNNIIQYNLFPIKNVEICYIRIQKENFLYQLID
jgi:hypothetical protein